MTPQKGTSKQAHDHRAARLLLECFGPSRKAASLNRRDWDAFIRWRRSQGDRRRGRPPGAPLRNRVIEYDLRFLHAVLNWAVASGVLDRNPLQELPWPREPAPRRPVVRHDEYEALRAVAHTVHPLFDLALVLAHETGHRIGAIRVLRWSDLDLRRGVVRWRAATDKMGVEHETLLTPEALAALTRRQTERPAIGDTWVSPASHDPTEPCSRYHIHTWWRRAERPLQQLRAPCRFPNPRLRPRAHLPDPPDGGGR